MISVVAGVTKSFGLLSLNIKKERNVFDFKSVENALINRKYTLLYTLNELFSIAMYCVANSKHQMNRE